MESLKLSESDIIHHVVKFGIDIYPTVEIDKERTRLNMFYEEARARYPELCEQLIAGGREFRISKEFRPSSDAAGPRVRVDTFVLTNRGPVFIIPVRLPDPIGSTGLEDKMLEAFKAVKGLFFSALAERKKFSGAKLKSGKCSLVYRDDLCNVRFEFEPAEVMKTTKLPVGAEITERQSFGLHVLLDVNNHQPKPLEDDDMERVIDRASSLWPDELLKYF